jgi:phosphoribosylformylglycinamidine synthase
VALVGLIEKPEHITTQWFKDEGDAIVLLGDIIEETDKLAGLGGSAYLQVIHGKKTGTPPRLNLDEEANLHRALRSLIVGGGIKSAHDCSEGGLAVALAESCISQLTARGTPRFIGATVDLTAALLKDATAPRLDALLFGESQGRVVITCAALDATKVVERAKILGVPAMRIGTVGGDALKIKTPAGEVAAPVAELHDGWWNSIARTMK